MREVDGIEERAVDRPIDHQGADDLARLVAQGGDGGQAQFLLGHDESRGVIGLE